MNSLLWNPEYQNVRVFGWEELLQAWSNTLRPSQKIDILLANLRASSDPSGATDYPIQHFKTYLNDEDAGLKWLVYEIIVQRWMYGRVRLDYLADLVEHVDLNSTFPVFVGSPLQTRTVRQFLEENLSRNELDEVNMMPGLEQARTSFEVTVGQQQTRSKREPALFQIRLLREQSTEKGCEDDVMTIKPTNDGTYTLIYNDQFSDQKTKTQNMGRYDLLRHLSVVLRSLALDEDPFLNVQVLSPNAPSVMLPTKLDSYSRELVYDMLETVMDNWPTTLVRAS